ncbi:hypothetical protein POM88_000867 [Heracleum sosnowskyi]|uniref:DUF627 domain-containing protein n=1 Tax=Heracleum sosnowskyi TaxID=360622 RepID=A0AAD8JF24_9APIA|nr:hypothetical protein POM88_000867 [Heracleum sosnowskyi]
MKALCGDIKSVIDLGLVYGVQGTFCFMATSIIDDVGMKEKYLRNANESAKKATVLSPNSVEYAHFYAKLLYEAAKEYDEVAKEYVFSTVKMLEKQSNHVDHNFIYESYERKDIHLRTTYFVDNNSSKDVHDSSPQEKEMVDKFESEGL